MLLYCTVHIIPIFQAVVTAMRRKQNRSMRLGKAAGAVILPLLAGVGALTITAAVLSAIAASLSLSDSVISGMSGVSLAAGCFAAAYRYGQYRRSGGLMTGIVWGIIVFAAVLLAGCLTVKVFSAGGILIKLVITVTASAVGGICGVNSKPYFR